MINIPEIPNLYKEYNTQNLFREFERSRIFLKYLSCSMLEISPVYIPEYHDIYVPWDRDRSAAGLFASNVLRRSLGWTNRPDFFEDIAARDDRGTENICSGFNNIAKYAYFVFEGR